jgi:hypothetical protein
VQILADRYQHLGQVADYREFTRAAGAVDADKHAALLARR